MSARLKCCPPSNSFFLSLLSSLLSGALAIAIYPMLLSVHLTQLGLVLLANDGAT
jgi:hypothetical protein